MGYYNGKKVLSVVETVPVEAENVNNVIKVKLTPTLTISDLATGIKNTSSYDELTNNKGVVFLYDVGDRYIYRWYRAEVTTGRYAYSEIKIYDANGYWQLSGNGVGSETILSIMVDANYHKYMQKAEYDALNEEINRINNILFETTIDEETLSFASLEMEALPSLVNSRSVVFGAGMDLKEIKGNSRVVDNQIVNSMPTKIITRGFNQCDEIYEGGVINPSGNNANEANTFRTTNYQSVVPNSNIYIRGNTSLGVIATYICEYDYDKNNLGRTILSGINTQFALKQNTRYIRLAFYKSDSGWGTNPPSKEQAQICINISNTTLNGTYRPYKAPITKPLNLPVLRSAGSVQDNTKNVNVGTLDLSTITFSFATLSSSGGGVFYANINGKANGTQNILSSDYSLHNSSASTMPINSILGNAGSNVVYICVPQTSGTVIGKGILNYELVIPTDQPTIELPENIKIEKGGSVEVEYYNEFTTPSDFDFAVAVLKTEE